MKKKYSLLESLKEDVGYTSERAEQIMADAKKALPMITDQAQRIYNMFTSITIGDLLEHGREELKKYEKAVAVIDKKVDAFKDALENISADMYDAGEKNLSREARNLESEYYNLYNQVDSLRSIVDKIDTEIMDWEDDFKDLKNFKK